MREIFLKEVRPEVSPKRGAGDELMVEMRQAGARSCRACVSSHGTWAFSCVQGDSTEKF